MFNLFDLGPEQKPLARILQYSGNWYFTLYNFQILLFDHSSVLYDPVFEGKINPLVVSVIYNQAEAVNLIVKLWAVFGRISQLNLDF